MIPLTVLKSVLWHGLESSLAFWKLKLLYFSHRPNLRGSHGLSARRAWRTKSRGPKGLQLEVGAWRAPRLLVMIIFGSPKHALIWQIWYMSHRFPASCIIAIVTFFHGVRFSSVTFMCFYEGAVRSMALFIADSPRTVNHWSTLLII